MTNKQIHNWFIKGYRNDVIHKEIFIFTEKKHEYDCIKMKMFQTPNSRDPHTLLVGVLSIIQDNTEGKREENIDELKASDDDKDDYNLCY